MASSSASYVILSVDGNIGSGKSTLVKALKQHYNSVSNENENKKPWKNYSGIIFIQEPVNIWMSIKDTNGETILSKFYGNTKKYAFSFQMMAYISRLHILKEAVAQYPNHIIVSERCVDTDKNVFAKMLYDDGNIEEVNYQIYLKWFDEFVKDIPIQGYIYVKTEPEICDIRIKKRNRDGESIPLAYLENCHKYHEEWLNNVDCVYTIDGNVDNADKSHDSVKSSAIEWINNEGWKTYQS